MARDREWPFGVCAYYKDDVDPPKEPGGLAIETKHRTEQSADMEVAAALSRDDIGAATKFIRERASWKA